MNTALQLIHIASLANLTPLIVGAAGAAAGGLLVALLTLGPQRKNLAAAAAQYEETAKTERQKENESLINSINTVRRALEERLRETEDQLFEYKARVKELEKELELATESRRANVAELQLQITRYEHRIKELEREVADLRARLPNSHRGRRRQDASPRQEGDASGPRGPRGEKGDKGDRGEPGPSSKA